ncbi:MAG: flagellar basal-body rod protein FlgF [Bdellovibrionales bacterium]
MESISLIALSRAAVLQRHMDIVANNIANSSTSGYKAERVLFEVAETKPTPNQPLDFVIDRGSYRDFSAGDVQMTSNPLDVALNGEGFFAVRLPDGKTAYTRNGSFTINTEGMLVDHKGSIVIGEGGTELSFPAETKDISIGSDGTISTEQAVLGKLQINTFDQPQLLRPYGDNYYVADRGTPGPNVDTRVIQGAIEGSNVSGVKEMTDMMQIVRSYQSVQKILESEHERIRNAISKIGRTA